MGNISLVKVGGVCAILVAVCFIVWFIVRGVTGVPGIRDLAIDGEQWLLDVGNNRTAFLTAMWFLLLYPVLLMPAALGFYQTLRQAGALLWIAVAAIFTGALLFIGASMTLIGVAYELAPGYVEASDASKAALALMASTLGGTAHVALSVAYLLSLGIGVGLFALAILRTSVVPKWVGWLGLVVVLIGAWPQALRSVSPVFTGIGFLGLLAFLVWMVVMGAVLLRLKEPVAPDSVA